MSEVIFSKKQIKPLIDKYSINVESDKTFKDIIVLFDNQTNYQIWAIKAVFGGICPLGVIKDIKNWADANHQEIKNLIKGNVVAYTRKEEFTQLMDEMQGLDMVATIKRVINQFNTDQRRILTENVLSHVSNGIDALASSTIKEWFKIAKGVETLNAKHKDKLISASSALRNYGELKEYIQNSYISKYDWNRESLLNFAAVNTPDCDLVYDKDNVVILNVPSFTSSKTLCGNGKTGWCLTRQESYFKQYVLDPQGGASQYFLFNFNLKDIHDFARIGFTVVNQKGINNAHSSTNRNLLSECVCDDGKRGTIHSILAELGIDKGIFMRLRKLRNYSWAEDSLLKYLSDNHFLSSIVFARDKMLILKMSSNEEMRKLAAHTFINIDDRSVDNFLLINFNVNNNDSNSIIKVSVNKDKYGIESINRIIDAYNADITTSNVLKKLNIEIDDFINRKDIDPNLLLHKLLDEKNDTRAAELIASKDVDINYVFENQYPIFKAINSKCINVFRGIVNSKNFNATVKDAMGEPLLLSLMCRYKSEKSNGRDSADTKAMIEIILDNTNYDFNAKDLNFDTAINLAAEYPVFDFVLQKLVENPNVNLNVVNDIQCTSLGNAIRRNNVNAIKTLGKRVDLVVRDQDYEMARKKGIDLAQYINPQAMTNPQSGVDTNGLSSELAELFAKVFNLDI